jgi:hypothetical protein
MRRVAIHARFLCFLLLAGLVLAAACRPRPEAPEEAIQQLLAQATEAVEKRDVGALSGLLSAAYGDPQGRERETILARLRYYFIGHQSIHLLTRTRSIDVMGEAQAQAIVLVAMAGEPLADPSEPTFLKASLYRFEFDFVQEKGVWKVRQARWQEADLRDFL